MTVSEKRFWRLALARIERERRERARLAAMLHNDVAQNLTGAGLQLDLLRMDLEVRLPDVSARTAEVQMLLERVVNQIRQLSYELNPGVVERAGLQTALDLLAGRVRKEFDGKLRLLYDSSARVPVDAAAAMEKIAGEAVRNAIRHARCSHIAVVVKAVREGAALEVRDDGAGFNHAAESQDPTGLGLSLMQFWADEAGLHLSIQTRPGATVIQASTRAHEAGPS